MSNVPQIHPFSRRHGDGLGTAEARPSSLTSRRAPRRADRRGPGPRGRGRRQVREGVARAVEPGHHEPREGGPEGSPRVTALSVTASGPAAAAMDLVSPRPLNRSALPRTSSSDHPQSPCGAPPHPLTHNDPKVRNPALCAHIEPASLRRECSGGRKIPRPVHRRSVGSRCVAGAHRRADGQLGLTTRALVPRACAGGRRSGLDNGRPEA